MGKPNRVKLRYREYIDTGDVFFEVKKKIKGMRTDKYRVREEAIINGFTAKGEGLMERLKVNALGMEGKVWTHYIGSARLRGARDDRPQHAFQRSEWRNRV